MDISYELSVSLKSNSNDFDLCVGVMCQTEKNFFKKNQTIQFAKFYDLNRANFYYN